MNKLLQLIGDGEQPSTLRVAVLLIIAPIMTVWTVLCIKQNQFVIPDAKILALVVSALGSKALQAFAERDPAGSGHRPDATPLPPGPEHISAVASFLKNQTNIEP